MFGLGGKLSENLIILVLTSFAFASILSVGVSMKIKDGQMSGCPFMVANQATLCQMSVTEHITQWQQAFFGIPTKTNVFALVIVLLTLVIIPFVKPFFKIKEVKKFVEQLLACRAAHILKVFDPLLRVFRDGILNPRIYEPAHI